MDTKKLEIFKKAVELGSLTKVAEMYGYTQSAITQLIHTLEKELGVTLLIRGRNGVVLSPEGKKLLPSINTMLVQAKQLEHEIDLITTSRNTTVKVSAYASVIMTWMPYIIRNYHNIHPDIKVEISSSDIDETYNAVLNDKVDLAFASRQDYPDLEFIHLHDDPFLAVLPNEEQYRNLTEFPIKNFDNAPFIMPYYGCEKDIDRYFEMEEVNPVVEPAMVDDMSLIHMIEHGMGLSILSELVMQGNKNDVITLPLTPSASREMIICLKDKKSASPLVLDFIKVAVDTVNDMYK